MGTKMSSSTNRQQLLQQLRAFSCSGSVKRAALGGEQETAFEQSFASLAYTYIQDKAPGLLDFLVGFQLVDKSEDNTRAVGIFGFKIGDQWAYVPVFFLNGDLRGHELLYLKNQDSFVPLKENWVNYLIAKRPHILGRAEPQDARGLGVMEPNLSALSTPPSGGKYASDKIAPNIPGWLKPIMPKVAQWITQSPNVKYASLAKSLDFRTFVKNDVRLVKLARDIGRAYPSVKKSMDELYGKNMLPSVLTEMRQEALSQQILGKSAADALEMAERRKKTVDKSKAGILAKTSASDEAPKVEVITDVTVTENLPEMDDAERQKLLRDGYLIRDHRNGKEVTRAYNVQVEMALSNPDNTDVYSVLVKPGSFERCLAIVNPHSRDGRGSYVTLVRLDGEKTWENIHASRIFVRQQARGKSDIEEFGDWYDKLDGSSKTSLEKGAVYVAVAKNGTGTAPFEIRESYDSDHYKVSWEDWGDKMRAEYLPKTAPCTSNCAPYGGNDTIRFNAHKGAGFRSMQGTLYVPDETKLIKVKDAPKCKKCDKTEDNCTCEYFSRNYEDQPSPLQPGSLDDLQLEIMFKTAELKVWTDHNDAIVNRRRMTKLAALVHLVRDYGLREAQAKTILKEAETKMNGVKYRVKAAQPMMEPYPTMQGPGMPAFPDPNMGYDPAYGGVQTMMPMEQQQVIPEMSAANTDPSIYDPMQMIDPMALQTAQSGQQQGQKEIFDTSMIGAMLKAIREDSLVDRYLGDLLNALDKLGRILFLLYWHNEEFRERYGKQDLPELEDTTRNAFEILGDLVLFLKQKAIGPASDLTQHFGGPNIESAARA